MAAMRFSRQRANDMDDYAFLLRSDIFASLPDELLKYIYSKSKLIIYPPRSIVFREGDYNADIYVIKSGVVEVQKETNDSDKPLVMAYLTEGECFGEMALITKMPRTATVRVPEKAKILRIPYLVYEKLLNENNVFNRHLCEVLAMRLERTSRQMVEERELSGKLEYFDLGVVIQALSSSLQSGIMALKDNQNTVVSEIVFAEGQIIKVRTGAIQGEDAFFQIFQDNVAKEFVFQGSEVEEKPNVDMGTMNLLMESARLQDELKILKVNLPEIGKVFTLSKTEFTWDDEETREEATAIWKLIGEGAPLSRILNEIPRCSYVIYYLINEMLTKGIIH